MANMGMQGELADKKIVPMRLLRCFEQTNAYAGPALSII